MFAAIDSPSIRRRWRRLGRVLLASSSVGVTVARPVGSVPADPAHAAEHPVKFRADRVEVDPAFDRLELAGDVRVQADRYQLTADRLELQRVPQGLRIRGPGRIAFCPCPRPPIAFGFRSVIVAPPTDLLVTSPTLHWFGVPVLWAPYLWLRSPDRTGLLPATVAYRGRDGWLLGSGVHFPWGDHDSLGRRSSLDLAVSGYLEGGVEARATMLTEQSTTAIRWDHLGDDLLAVEAHGSASSGSLGAATAWLVDALRGPRALVGTLSLEAAARRYDRVRWIVVHSTPSSILASSWRTDAIRGGGFRELGATGPRLSVGFGRALSDLGTLEVEADSTTLGHADFGTVSRLSAGARVRVDTRPSVLTVSLEAGARGQVLVTELAEAGHAEGFGRAELALPLVRSFGAKSDPWRHWVEPFLEVIGSSARTEGVWRDFAEGRLIGAVGGIRSAVGRYGARGALSSALRAGWLGPPEAPSPVSGITLGATTEYWGLGGHLYALLAETGALASALRVRLGRQGGLHLAATLEGRERMEPLSARWLGPDPWRHVAIGWLDRSGWTAEGDIMLPWTAWLSSSFGVARELTREEWLGWRGALAYRHPCGCLGVVSGLSQRIGREGVDGWLSVQLVP